MSIAAIHHRRRVEREELLDLARSWEARLAGQVRAVVVHGSVARGDFNLWSDVDVLVVDDSAPGRWIDRADRYPPAPGRVQVVVWTSHEFARQLQRGNPMAVEAVSLGVWLRGAAPDLSGPVRSTRAGPARPGPRRPSR